MQGHFKNFKTEKEIWFDACTARRYPSNIIKRHSMRNQLRRRLFKLSAVSPPGNWFFKLNYIFLIIY